MADANGGLSMYELYRIWKDRDEDKKKKEEAMMSNIGGLINSFSPMGGGGGGGMMGGGGGMGPNMGGIVSGLYNLFKK